MCWWVLFKQINSSFCHVSKCGHLFVEPNPRPWASGSTPVQQRWVGDKVGGSSPAVLPSTIHHVDWMVNVVLWFVTHWSETGRIHITDVTLQKLLSRMGNWGLGRKLGGWSAIRSEWTAADSSLVDVNHVVVPLCRGLGNILKQPILDAYMWLDSPTNSAVGYMNSSFPNVYWIHPYPLKNGIWGGEPYWNFILKFHFCNHVFSMINIPHHSMSLASR